jgi:chorismate mutase
LGTCVYFTVSSGITGIPFGSLVSLGALDFERVGVTLETKALVRGKNRRHTMVVAAIAEYKATSLPLILKVSLLAIGNYWIYEEARTRDEGREKRVREKLSEKRTLNVGKW